MRQSALKSRGSVLIPSLWVARDFFSRFLGLMGRKGLSPEEALLFPRCNSIHTFFMRFPIDVIFLDEKNVIVEVIERMPAWRMLLPRRAAKHTLEMAGGRAKALGLTKGIVLEWGDGKGGAAT